MYVYPTSLFMLSLSFASCLSQSLTANWSHSTPYITFHHSTLISYHLLISYLYHFPQLTYCHSFSCVYPLWHSFSHYKYWYHFVYTYHLKSYCLITFGNSLATFPPFLLIYSFLLCLFLLVGTDLHLLFHSLHSTPTLTPPLPSVNTYTYPVHSISLYILYYLFSTSLIHLLSGDPQEQRTMVACLHLH